MNGNENKQIDNLARKVIKGAALESPSFDFTAQIMTQLSVLEQSEATIYKPLISKTTWLGVFIAFAALVGYAVMGTEQKTISWFGFLDLNNLVNHKFSDILCRFTFSKILLYALTSLSVMVLVQVSFLKSYFNKRFEV